MKWKRKRSSLSLNQSHKKNEKYVNALMKENPEKYALMYGSQSSTNVVCQWRKTKKYKCDVNKCSKNEKNTQVFLCCGEEIESTNRQCPSCRTRTVHVVDMSTQAYFVGIDEYVDQHLQNQLPECNINKQGNEHCTSENSNTREIFGMQMNDSTAEIYVGDRVNGTPENEST